MKKVEVWRDELKIAKWLFAAAKKKFRWPQGREVTLESFKECIESARNHRIG